MADVAGSSSNHAAAAGREVSNAERIMSEQAKAERKKSAGPTEEEGAGAVLDLRKTTTSVLDISGMTNTWTNAPGVLAGVLALEAGEPSGRPSVFIHEVARDPALPESMRGIGTALMREALQAVSDRFERTPEVVQLLVDVGNVDAIGWYRGLGFAVIAGLVGASGEASASELPGARPIYEPEWRPGRRRGGTDVPLQLCMQADGEALLRRLRARPAAQRMAELERHGPDQLGALRRSAAWTAARRLVDAAHNTTRGAASGGSGRKATELLPPRAMEERVTYVLARLRAPQRSAGPTSGLPVVAGAWNNNGDSMRSKKADPVQSGGNDWDVDEELEEEQAMMAETGGPMPPDEMSPPDTPGTSVSSSPAPTPSPSVAHVSPAGSPAPSRPPSPASVRWRATCEADNVEGDEEETLGTMAARLRQVRAEEEARFERKRSLEARGTLNARKGFVHALRVGEADGAEHGAMHERRCKTEATRIGRARASVEGIGPRPRLRGLDGGCVCCGWRGGCTPRHVLLGECGCAQVDWAGYLTKLLEAFMHVKEAVPKTTLDVSTPLAAWCQCRPVICAAVAALERRLAGGDAGEAGWRAVRMVLTGLLPECMKVAGMEEQERRRVEARVAKAVVEAQAVAARLLGLYGTATRKLRAERREQLEAWWVEERRRRALRARMGKLLRAESTARLAERKRRRETIADVVAGAQVAAVEGERRKRLRCGDEVAHTRKRGLHRGECY